MSTPPWLKSLLEEHLEELEMLGEHRRMALEDEDYTISDLLELDQRIEAHVDALLLARDSVLPTLLAGLEADEAMVVFASAFTLLRMRDAELAQAVIRQLQVAEGEALDGLREALLLAPLEFGADEVLQLIPAAPGFRAVAALEIAAMHGRVDASEPRLMQLLNDTEPDIRAAAWRVAALLDARAARAGGTNMPWRPPG